MNNSIDDLLSEYVAMILRRAQESSRDALHAYAFGLVTADLAVLMEHPDTRQQICKWIQHSLINQRKPLK